MVNRIQQYIVVGSILVSQMLLGACTTTYLISPMTMGLVTSKTPEASSRIAKAIKMALAERGWGVESQQAGSMIAILYVRSHMVKIKLLYNSNQILAYYMDSENMNFDGEMIHKKYHVWIDLLFKSIRKYLVAV
jgi:hypothetical protein